MVVKDMEETNNCSVTGRFCVTKVKAQFWRKLKE
jgi:hypothetical protein